MIKKFIKKALIVKILFSINNQWSVESKNNPSFVVHICNNEDNIKKVESLLNEDQKPHWNSHIKKTKLNEFFEFDGLFFDKDQLYKLLLLGKDKVQIKNKKTMPTQDKKSSNFIEDSKKILDEIKASKNKINITLNIIKELNNNFNKKLNDFTVITKKLLQSNLMEKTKIINKLLKTWNLEKNEENFNKIMEIIEELQIQEKTLQDKTNFFKNWFLETFNCKDKNPWGSNQSINFINKQLNDLKIINITQDLKLDIQNFKNYINKFNNKLDIESIIKEQAEKNDISKSNCQKYMEIKIQKEKDRNLLAAKLGLEDMETSAPMESDNNFQEIRKPFSNPQNLSPQENINAITLYTKLFFLAEEIKAIISDFDSKIISGFFRELLNIFKNINPALEEKINGVEEPIENIKFEYIDLYLYKLLDIIHNDSYSNEEYIHQWNIFLDCIINK